MNSTDQHIASLKNKNGFTLIELLVVITIIGILAAIAIPIYSTYRNNAFRSTAKTALVIGAQNMERYFTRNNSYSGTTVGDTAAGDQLDQWTEGNKYQLSIEKVDDASYTLLATPQFSDKCGELRIDETGAKNPTTQGCW